MNLESFDDFLEWFKTNRYVSVAEPSFDAEASKIKLKCLHCQQAPFTVFVVKKGGWNIGHFTRHLNADSVTLLEVVKTRSAWTPVTIHRQVLPLILLRM